MTRVDLGRFAVAQDEAWGYSWTLVPRKLGVQRQALIAQGTHNATLRLQQIKASCASM